MRLTLIITTSINKEITQFYLPPY